MLRRVETGTTTRTAAVGDEGRNTIAMGMAPLHLLVALLALGVVPLLLTFRFLDDNRLTSWQWVFAGVDPVRLYAIMILGIILAHLMARLSVSGIRGPVLLFLLSYGVSVPFWSQPEPILDASRYFAQAKHLELYGIGYFFAEWGRTIPAWTDLPLVPFLYGLVFKFLGETRVHIQVVSTLFFSSTVVLTFLLGKALWNEDVGFLGAVLLLGIPYLLTQVPSMMADVPTMFFLMAAVYAFLQALEHGGSTRILIASLALFLAFFSKYSAWLCLSVLPIMCLLPGRGDTGRRLRVGLRVGLISGSLIGATLAWKQGEFSQQLGLLLSYQAPGLSRWGESFISTFLFQVHPFVTAAALLSLYVAARKRDCGYVLLAWPVLIFFALQIQRIRYMIPVFPMLALMGAHGLQAIRTRELRRFVAGCAVVSSCIVASCGYLPFLQRLSAVNLMEAGQYLDTIAQDPVEVFALPQPDSDVNPAVAVPILDLFTAKKLIYRYDPNTAEPGMRSATSALRFTWEYTNPRYYIADGVERETAVVIISGEMEPELPAHIRERLEGYRLSRVFAAQDNVFQYRTIVRVYQKTAYDRSGNLI